MKILLVYLSGALDRSDPYISIVPVGLCSLHSALREAGYNSLLANFSGWSSDQIRKEIAAFSPDVVGISQWTHNRHAAMELAQQCRDLLPDALIMMGGGHATFCFKELLVEGSPIDLIVLGEGEATLLELLDRMKRSIPWDDVTGIVHKIADRIIENPSRELMADLDLLPDPSKYLEYSQGIDLKLQPEFILTARGCPSACHFCSSPAFWGRKVRYRSPAVIVDEIIRVRDRFGVIYFSMRDDTFTANKQRTMEFCHLLEKRKAGVLWNCQSRATAVDTELLKAMKRAGCECIQLGVESGSPRILRQLGKTIMPAQVTQAATMIREVGINLSIYLISDVPGEEEEDYRQTVALLRSICPDDGYVSPLAYFPGTRLFLDAVATDRVTGSIFDDSCQDAVYVNGKPGKGGQRLIKAIDACRQQSVERFVRQKELLGYCWTTNIIKGEWLRTHGKLRAARIEFEEICRLEPDNPWGWFLLADLNLEQENIKEARKCYTKVLEIVPRHAASLEALSEL